MSDGAASAPPEQNSSTCWTCGRAANPASTLPVVLEHVGTPPDAMGYPVTVRKNEATVEVPMPSCGSCRSWFAWQQGVMVISIVVGIFAPGLAILAYAHLTDPGLLAEFGGDDMQASHLVLLFGCILLSGVASYFGGMALLALALGQRPLRSHNQKNYPPVVALRALGWHFQMSSD